MDKNEFEADQIKIILIIKMILISKMREMSMEERKTKKIIVSVYWMKVFGHFPAAKFSLISAIALILLELQPFLISKTVT